MTRNTKTPRSGVIAAIALVLRTIAKEDAHNRPRRELGTLNGRKEYINRHNQRSADDHRKVHKIEDA